MVGGLSYRLSTIAVGEGEENLLMSKRYGRRNQNRPPKPPRAPQHPASQKRSGGTVTAHLITHQDSILPVKLNFPPPLIELATDPSTFEYNWQQLTYAFDLPDPAKFPGLSLIRCKWF